MKIGCELSKDGDGDDSREFLGPCWVLRAYCGDNGEA